MSDEITLSYASDIVVKVRHNQEVYVELTSQGPQGPEGPAGDITDELKALRVEVVTACDAANASKDNAAASATAASTSRSNSAASATEAKASETNAKTSETNANVSRIAAAGSADKAKISEDNSKESETNAGCAKNAALTSSVNAKESETNAWNSDVSAKASESSALASKNAAAVSATASAKSEEDALASKNTAKTSETNAKTSETNAKTSETAAGLANTSVQNAKALIDAAKTATEAARNDAQAARGDAQAAKTQTETARDDAQTAKTDAQAVIPLVNAARDAAAVSATKAETAAAEAAKFNPAFYPTKTNNGSDFADPAAVRDNIGAQAKLPAVTQAEAEAGTVTTDRNWSPKRIQQAIVALGSPKLHTHVVSDITGLQVLLNKKAELNSPSFTGTPLAPTAISKSNNTQLANTEYVDRAISELLGGAVPETLDTFKEIADRLAEDADAMAALTQMIAGKADSAHTHVINDITGLTQALGLKASLASPNLTGTPTAPTAATTDNSTKLATTAHVKAAINSAGLATASHTHAIADVTDLKDALDGKASASHTHVAADISDLAELLSAKSALASPAFTGTPTAPTQAVGDNSTRLATTAFVATSVANGLSGKANSSHSHAVSDVTGLQDALGLKAPLASPTLTGTPSAPTAAAGTNTTQIATTAFTAQALAAFSTSFSASINDTLNSALNLKANLASPTLTGTPTAPTAAAGTNTTQLATTSFVTNGIATAMNTKFDKPSGSSSQIMLGSGLAANTIPVTALGLTYNNTAEISVTVNDEMWVYLTDGSNYGLKQLKNLPVNAHSHSMANIAGLSAAFDLKANSASPVFTGTLSAGTIIASGNISAYSDMRLKTDIETITDALSMVERMRGVRFTMNGERNLGVIAQEIRKVVPELVRENNDEAKTLSVTYGNTVGILIEAIKELKIEVDNLKRAV